MSDIEANRSDYQANYKKNIQAAIEEAKQEKLKAVITRKKPRKRLNTSGVERFNRNIKKDLKL